MSNHTPVDSFVEEAETPEVLSKKLWKSYFFSEIFIKNRNFKNTIFIFGRSAQNFACGFIRDHCLMEILQQMFLILISSQIGVELLQKFKEISAYFPIVHSGSYGKFLE